MSKADLRAEAIARRAAMGGEERRAASLAAAAHALAAAGPAPGVVSVFMSIGEEIDTEPLAAALDARGVALALPVVLGRGLPLLFRRWRPGEALTVRGWNIREPADEAPAVAPDTLFCPLAAFDGTGARLGYGAGYYDRSLAALRATKPVRAIGYAFACQELPGLPAEPHDEPLDAVVTERGVHFYRDAPSGP